MSGGMYTGSVLDDINSKPSALERSEKMMSQGMATMNKTQPNIPKPEKTVASGAMSALGGAGAGAMIGSTWGPTGTAAGAIIGGTIGLAQYYTA